MHEVVVGAGMLVGAGEWKIIEVLHLGEARERVGASYKIEID